MQKILIVNVNWLGDVIFSTPFIKAIRMAYPDAYIACLLHPRCADILKGSPRLNEIIIYDEEGAHRNMFGKMKLIGELRKKHFDIAFILHRSFTKALLTFLAGIKERVGYATKGRGGVLTKSIEVPDTELHKVEYFLNIARSYGIEVKETSYEFFISDADRNSIKKFLKDNNINNNDRVAVICPGGNWDPKRWPKENFAHLADMLSENLGFKAVISGAKKDEVLAGEIKKLMKQNAVISCGRTTLKELGALLERANIVVANDSGPMHIAVAMKAKTIALFGPTSPLLTGPYGKGNYHIISKNEECEIPCYDVTCTDNRCMKLITVEDVFKEAQNIINHDSR